MITFKQVTDDGITTTMELPDDVTFDALFVYFLYFCRGITYDTEELTDLLDKHGG